MRKRQRDSHGGQETYLQDIACGSSSRNPAIESAPIVGVGGVGGMHGHNGDTRDAIETKKNRYILSDDVRSTRWTGNLCLCNNI